jgi:hypothetical protein
MYKVQNCCQKFRIDFPLDYALLHLTKCQILMNSELGILNFAKAQHKWKTSALLPKVQNEKVQNSKVKNIIK